MADNTNYRIMNINKFQNLNNHLGAFNSGCSNDSCLIHLVMYTFA